MSLKDAQKAIKRKAWEEALIAVEQVLESRCNASVRYEALCIHGFALGKLNRYNEALATLMEATELDPRAEEAWKGIAKLCTRVPVVEHGDVFLKAFTFVKPKKSFTFSTAVILAGTGEEEKAVSVLNNLLVEVDMTDEYYLKALTQKAIIIENMIDQARSLERRAKKVPPEIQSKADWASPLLLGVLQPLAEIKWTKQAEYLNKFLFEGGDSSVCDEISSGNVAPSVLKICFEQQITRQASLDYSEKFFHIIQRSLFMFPEFQSVSMALLGARLGDKAMLDFANVKRKGDVESSVVDLVCSCARARLLCMEKDAKLAKNEVVVGLRLRKSLELPDSKSAEFYSHLQFSLALVYTRSRQRTEMERARELWDKLLESSVGPIRVEASIEKARLLRRLGYSQQAVELLRTFEHVESTAEAIALLGEIECESNFEAGVSLLKQAIEYKPENAKFIFKLAKAMWTRSGCNDEVISLLAKSIKLDRNYADPLAYLGHCYRGNDLKKAVRCYQMCLTLDSAHPLAGAALADIMMETSRRDAASTLLLGAVAAESWAFWAWKRLAVLAKDSNDEDAMMLYLQKSVQTSSDADAEPEELGRIWSDLGLAYQKQGKFDAALKSYLRSIELSSKDPIVTFRLGFLYIFLRMLTEAEELLSSHESSREDAPLKYLLARVYYERAIELSDLGASKAAIDLYFKAIFTLESCLGHSSLISLRKLEGDSWFRLAELHIRSDKDKSVEYGNRALKAFQACSSSSPDSAEAVYDIALTNWLAFIASNDRVYAKAARDAINAALAITSTKLKYWILGGFICEELALRQHCLLQAIELAPNNADPWNAYGLLCIAEGDLLLAKEVFSVAQTLDPSKALLWFGFGILRWAEGDFAHSFDFFSRSLEFQHFTDSRLWLAKSALKIRNYDMTLFAATKFLHQVPSSSEAKILRAQSLVHFGDYGKALTLIEPENPETRQLLALCYCSTGDFGRGLIIYRKLLKESLSMDLTEEAGSMFLKGGSHDEFFKAISRLAINGHADSCFRLLSCALHLDDTGMVLEQCCDTFPGDLRFPVLLVDYSHTRVPLKGLFVLITDLFANLLATMTPLVYSEVYISASKCAAHNNMSHHEVRRLICRAIYMAPSHSLLWNRLLDAVTVNLDKDDDPRGLSSLSRKVDLDCIPQRCTSLAQLHVETGDVERAKHLASVALWYSPNNQAASSIVCIPEIN